MIIELWLIWAQLWPFFLCCRWPPCTYRTVPSFNRVADELQRVLASVLDVWTATGGYKSHPVSNRYHRTSRFLRRHISISHGHRLRPHLPLVQPHQTQTQVTSSFVSLCLVNIVWSTVIERHLTWKSKSRTRPPKPRGKLASKLQSSALPPTGVFQVTSWFHWVIRDLGFVSGEWTELKCRQSKPEIKKVIPESV